MKILVLVKQVPDTYGDRVLSLETGLTDREASAAVMDEICERALEVALAYAETAEDTEVVAVMMAAEPASALLRNALAMGADAAVQIVDPGLLGADISLTADVLARAAARTSWDLIIAGNASTDGSGGMVPAIIAELLDAPSALNLNTVQISATAVSGRQQTDTGTVAVSAPLPAVISVTERLPDARMASFSGLRAAKKKPFETLTLADLDIDPLSLSWPRSIMTEVTERPPRAAGVQVVDDGDAANALAAYLIENRLV